jgi:hypothetical protein
MQLKSNALPNLIWRLKPAINPATRFFLVALFIVGFTGSYFGDLHSKTHPQYAANADVFSCTACWHYVRLERWERAWLEARQRYARN